jgi:hypothetical protein
MTVKFDSVNFDISFYHVTDTNGVHGFITINDYHLHLDGGHHGFEERLRAQYASFELVGKCTIRPFASAGWLDVMAAMELVAKTKAIARQHPGCDPVPHPWVPPADSDDEPAILRATARNIVNLATQNGKTSELWQILADTEPTQEEL